VYYGAPPDDWQTLASFDRDPANHVHFSSWERLSLPVTSTRYLRFVFTEASNGEIGEILVLSAANEKLVPVAVTGDGAAQRFVDEHELITLPITQKYGAYFDEMYFAALRKSTSTSRSPMNGRIRLWGSSSSPQVLRASA
jgi:hypothetical protein